MSLNIIGLGLPVPPESGAFSPYNAFVKEYWTTHKAKHDPDGTEDVKVYDKEVFLKACGEACRDLPTAEKTKYTDSSNELRKAAKEAYYAFYSSLKPGEFARINAALPPSSRIPRPSGTRIPDGVARRPGGSFMFFVKDKIDSSSDTLMKDQVSELGARWRNMTAEEKAVSETSTFLVDHRCASLC